MRNTSSAPAAASNTATPTHWSALFAVLPYFWQFKTRVVIALGALLAAKVASFSTPITLKYIVNSLSLPLTALSVPILLLLTYGAARFSVSLFTELRELVFARVTQHTARVIALKVFSHLHEQSLRFHLARQTGGLTRDIERGTRAISSLTSYLLYSIAPTIFEILLVMGYMALHYEPWFALITLTALIAYITYTVLITNWRSNLRREMNTLDTRANTQAIDALINFETVKYFDNVAFESKRYDHHLAQWEEAAVRSQTSLSLLNLGQALIVIVAVVLVMWRAAIGVTNGSMTVGDLVLVNVFLLQLYIPLNFLGVLYREIRQGLIDLEKVMALLQQEPEIKDAPNAQAPTFQHGEIHFNDVHFRYDSNRPILKNLSFHVPAGSTLAIVGTSGAGKSTIVRLLFRFYDVQQGSILIDGIDIRQLQQHNLRSQIGIVPQDTVLFNDTIGYNIRYGRPDCTEAEMLTASRGAAIDHFISTLPNGYDTLVGERGLKLSGGEKQRIAIARTLLKNPKILVLDEATAALDYHTEGFIQTQLNTLSQNRTTVIIAHRLSTITHADHIIVMQDGQIIERGNHHSLLAQNGAYHALWQKQAQKLPDNKQ